MVLIDHRIKVGWKSGIRLATSNYNSVGLLTANATACLSVCNHLLRLVNSFHNSSVYICPEVSDYIRCRSKYGSLYHSL